MFITEHIRRVVIIQDIHDTAPIPIVGYAPTVIDVTSGIFQNLQQERQMSSLAFQQALHLVELREVTREWHAKGDESARAAFFRDGELARRPRQANLVPRVLS